MIKSFFLYLALVIAVYSVGMYAVIAAPLVVTDVYNSNQIDMYISYEYDLTENDIYTTAQIMLDTHRIPLNAFMAELYVDSNKAIITDVKLHENLCEPRFIIEKIIDNTVGRVQVTCGSATPFVTEAQFEPIVTVYMVSEGHIPPKINFGENSGFYIHDGYGTRAITNIVKESQDVY